MFSDLPWSQSSIRWPSSSACEGTFGAGAFSGEVPGAGRLLLAVWMLVSSGFGPALFGVDASDAMLDGPEGILDESKGTLDESEAMRGAGA